MRYQALHSGEPSDLRENACAWLFSTRKKVNNTIFFFFCGSISCISAVHFKLSITKIYAERLYFFVTHQATGSLGSGMTNKAIAYTPLEGLFINFFHTERAYIAHGLNFKLTQSFTWIISARWQTKKIIQLTQVWKSINESSFICKDLKFTPFCRFEIKEHALWKSKHTKLVKFNFEKFGGICSWHNFGEAAIGEIVGVK